MNIPLTRGRNWSQVNRILLDTNHKNGPVHRNHVILRRMTQNLGFTDAKFATGMPMVFAIDESLEVRRRYAYVTPRRGGVTLVSHRGASPLRVCHTEARWCYGCVTPRCVAVTRMSHRGAVVLRLCHTEVRRRYAYVTPRCVAVTVVSRRDASLLRLRHT
eukprot:3684888-Pyramimonas_sp.AAC.1